jgi:hypothetical protein
MLRAWACSTSVTRVLAGAEPLVDLEEVLTLPRAADQHAGNGLLEPRVGVGYDQLHPTQPARIEQPQERSPERGVLAVTHREPEDFAPPVRSNACGNQDGLGDDTVVDLALQ